MTCIVAMVRNDKVWMAGDLMGSDGYTKKVYPDSKVFQVGDFLLGYTSSFRMGQILQYNWEPPARIEGLEDREYLQVDVIESIRSTFKAFGYGSHEDLEDIGGNFLIGYRDSLYEMQPNFSLLKHDDFAAIGSGESHAEAVLSLMFEEAVEPVICLEQAIATAARFTTSVSYEYTIISNVTEEDEEESPVIDEVVPTIGKSCHEVPIFSTNGELFGSVEYTLADDSGEVTDITLFYDECEACIINYEFLLDHRKDVVSILDSLAGTRNSRLSKERAATKLVKLINEGIQANETSTIWI